MSTNGQVDTFSGYVPYVKEGAGFSDEDLLLCFRLCEATRPVILRALEKIPCDGHTTFTIGDYATGDGSASMSNIKEIIGILRKRHGDALPIHVLYEDTPENDYKSLVKRIHGLLPGCEPSFLSVFKNVYALIAPTGFHSACIAPKTLDLGFSTSSMQYLSKLPCNITGATHVTGITLPREKELFKEHAAKEWELLLLKRADELKTGGHFVIEAMATDDQGRYGGNYGTKANFFGHFTILWKKMFKEGIITEEEFHDTNSLHYLRTAEEYKAPFDDPNSMVYAAGLRLTSLEITCVRCPHNERWIKEGKHGDPVASRKHAERFVSSVRYWTNWLFMAGLSKRRPLAEREQIVDKLYSRYVDSVSLAPDDFSYDLVIALIDFEKV